MGIPVYIVPARAVPVLDPVLGLHYQFHPPLSQLLRVPVRVPVPAAFLVLVLGSPPMKKDLGVQNDLGLADLVRME
ncbi:hypothetical protein N7489_004038 [Penicillium chrysogenum]|uniref:uncharacterized protein n=1 Tax=Penicillium chrysogenum TaxID=5076 RepID=UPI0024DF103A|nr:uncharacterized protein N7489_004038 [Penicillium chrysogenum]KAJ5243942.1 hypothetical protein N7489_004038 [Penicillium chrysogenum]